MTPNELIANVRSRLGVTGEATLWDSFILTELQLAQTKLEGASTLPHELLKEKYVTSAVAVERLQVPTDFLKEYESSALWWVDSNGKFNELEKGFQDDSRDYWNQTYTGDDDTEGPRAYSLVGNYFFIYPTPSESYTFRMYYYASDDTLAVDGAANQWSTYYPDLLMGMAGIEMLLHHGVLVEEKQIALARFNQMIQESSNRLITKSVAREMSNMELSFGGG